MSESSKPLKFTLVRFASDPQSKSARKIVPTQSDVFLGELLGLDAHLTCALREPCSKVVLRVEALIDGGRSDQIFSNSANPWDILEPGQPVAASMQYAVRSESIRSITLTAWLTTSAGAVLSCSTAWPFRVAVPLALRTKARSLPDSKAGTGSEAPPAQDAPRPVCLLEARVENMTGGDLAVSPRLVPACPEVSLWSLNTRWPEAVEGGGGGGSSDCGGDSGVAEWMSGGSLCRRGAMVLQKNKGAYHWVVKSVGVDSETGSFGHLEVDWVAREGQRGRLVSQPLSPPSSSSPWVHFSVQGAPPTARQMVPFSAHVVIHSKASHPVGPFRLQMPAAAAATPSRDLERAIVSVGPLAHSVPVLEPGGSHKVRVELVGLLPGTQKVTGMMLYDGSKWVATAGAVEVAIDAG